MKKLTVLIALLMMSTGVFAQITAWASPGVICAGSSTTLNASGGISYVWNTGQSGASIAVSPMVTTVYTVIGTTVNGYTTEVKVVVVVQPLPLVSVLSSTDSICVGQSVTLTAWGDATTYLWDTRSVTNTITVAPMVTTTYSVFGVGVNGCISKKANITVSVYKP
jgi:hypothetical protein